MVKRRLRAPSPALVISLTALFISLSGTAVAAGVVPMAKQALFAKNAGKLQGKSARQVAAIPGPATYLRGMSPDDIAAMPSPTNSVSQLIGEVRERFTLRPGEERNVTAHCPEGTRAISGWAKAIERGPVATINSFPGELEHEWTVDVINSSDSEDATVDVGAICLI